MTREKKDNNIAELSLHCFFTFSYFLQSKRSDKRGLIMHNSKNRQPPRTSYA